MKYRLMSVVMKSGMCEVTVKPRPDRKSTRLNSSHTVISYAGFCLKKEHTCRSRVRISGPAGSDILRDMINVLKPDQLIMDRVARSTQHDDSQQYEFYSPSATARV